MAKTINNCCDCNAKFATIEVCDCFAGFQVDGLTADTEYLYSIKTAKTVYTRAATSDGDGTLLIPVTALPERVINRFGGIYELQLSDITFGNEQYIGYKFTVIDCNDISYKLLGTPNF